MGRREEQRREEKRLARMIEDSLSKGWKRGQWLSNEYKIVIATNMIGEKEDINLLKGS